MIIEQTEIEKNINTGRIEREFATRTKKCSLELNVIFYAEILLFSTFVSTGWNRNMRFIRGRDVFILVLITT